MFGLQITFLFLIFFATMFGVTALVGWIIKVVFNQRDSEYMDLIAALAGISASCVLVGYLSQYLIR